MGLYNPLSLDKAVEICKQLYILFIKNDIQIIRIGLQATDKINVNKDVVAGPFHPAFRELVESSIYISMIDYIIKGYFKNEKDLMIYINPREISKLFAYGKKYFKILKELYSNVNIKILQDDSIDRYKVKISDGKISKIMSFYEYIKLVI